MSNERARRRAERERAAAAAAAARTRAKERELRRRGALARLRAAGPRRRGRPDGLLAQRRRTQNATIAFLVVVAQVFGWLFFHSVQASVAILVFTVLAVPVLVTLALDRRG